MAPEPHSDPRSEWLVALLSGHLDEADPAVAAELARDPALAEQLAGLRRYRGAAPCGCRAGA
jgi:hypothetical protein